MDKEINKRLDEALTDTEFELSKFERAVRIALNSWMSDKISSVFFVIFEPKSLSISIILSLIVFYALFFASIILGYAFNFSILLHIIIFIYAIVRALKFIKNKIV